MAENLCNINFDKLTTKNECLSTLNDIRQHLKENKHLDFQITSRLLMSAIDNCLDEKGKSDAGENLKILLLINDILRLHFMDNLSVNKKCDNLFMDKYIYIKLHTLRGIHSGIVKLTEHSEEYPNVRVSDFISLEFVLYTLRLLQEYTKNMVGCIAFQIFRIVLENYLEEPSVKHALAEALEKGNDLVKVRLYEMACGKGDLTLTNFKHLQFVLDHAIGELGKDNNNLLQINILDIIGICAERDYGFNYFEDRKVFELLGKRIKEIPRTSENQNLILSIITFFSEMAVIEPRKIICVHRDVIFRIFEYLLLSNNSTLPKVLNVFANLTTSELCIITLENICPVAVKDVFATYSFYLGFPSFRFKFEVLESLRRIFTLEGNDEPETNDILKRWFIYLNDGTYTMSRITMCCFHRQSKIRTAALNVVRAVCCHPWGIQAFKNTTGFLQFLLKHIDRNTEANYAKYMLFVVLNSSNAFDARTRKRLRDYIVEYGP